MNKKILLGVAGAIALAEYGRYQRLVDSLSVKPKNFKFKKVGDELEIKFDLAVTNNSSKAIVIKSVEGNLVGKPNNLLIGNYSVSQETKIDSNQVTNLPIVANIKALSIAKNLEQNKQLSIFDAITIKTKAVIDYKLIGLLNLSIPISDTTTIAVGETLREIDGIIQDFKKLFNL